MNNEFTFKKGDVVEFCGELYEVIENHGVSGTVKELDTSQVITKFKWVFGKEVTKKVG